MFFKLSARLGLLLFGAVVWLGTSQGMEPGSAAIRVMLALLAVNLG